MPITAALVLGGSALIGSGISAFGSFSASKQQSDALKQALALQERMFNTANNALQPYITAGHGTLSTLTRLLTPGSDQTAALSELPGFQFAQDWGQKAVQNIGTTTGLGGNVLTAGAKFATGTAQQGFNSLVDRLESFANTGENAANALSGAAQGFSGQGTNTFSNIGQARAAGTLGVTNALGGGVNAAGNSYLLSKLLGPNSGTPNNNNANGVYSGNNALDFAAYGNPAGNPLDLAA